VSGPFVRLSVGLPPAATAAAASISVRHWVAASLKTWIPGWRYFDNRCPRTLQKERKMLLLASLSECEDFFFFFFFLNVTRI
jgi:hypothetical protein